MICLAGNHFARCEKAQAAAGTGIIAQRQKEILDMKSLIMVGALLLLAAAGFAQEYTLILNQPYTSDGPSLTSAYVPTYPADIEVAENFNGLADPITRIIFYGVFGVYDGTWIAGTPGTQEYFTVKFYDYNGGAEPTWASPLTAYSMYAAPVFVENYTWGGWSMYSMEIVLPAPVTMSEGWLSLQNDTSMGSGQWFGWNTGSGGNGSCQQRVDVRADGRILSIAQSDLRAPVSYDLGMELYTGGETLPVELSSFTATLTADLFVQIAWAVQSETNHLGYNILRGQTNLAAEALQINPRLIVNEDGTAQGTQTSYQYIDTEVITNSTYFYWLESLAVSGAATLYGPLSVLVSGEPGDPGIPPLPPAVTQLLPAYPNPFNPSTNIRFSLKEAEQVRIEIYNLKGNLLRSYEKNYDAPGYYQIVWDGKDAQGNAAASGIYLYRMTAGKYSAHKKMVLAK